MKKTLLIVDDEMATRKFLEHYFKADFNVITQPDGLQAKAWLEDGNPVDAIVADLDMPGLDGFAFINYVRSNIAYDDTAYITLSGSEKSADKIKCLNLGADDYVVKPFNPDEIKARINNIFKRIHR